VRAREIGKLPVELDSVACDARLFHGLSSSFVTCDWHGDAFDLPPGAVSLLRQEVTLCRAFRYGTNLYGLLFHLEKRPKMAAACLSAFESRIRQAGVDPAQCDAETERHVVKLVSVAETIFRRWTELVVAR
jgi:GMP synthase (glutamine-hydrolysing)